MKKLLMTTVAIFLLTGCNEVNYRYMEDEILKIAKFSKESIDRVKFALKNPKDLNLTELAKSLGRIEKAKNEIQGLRGE